MKPMHTSIEEFRRPGEESACLEIHTMIQSQENTDFPDDYCNKRRLKLIIMLAWAKSLYAVQNSMLATK